MSVLSKKALEAFTTLSKWQKGDIRRIYVNSPIYRWFGITMYYEKAPEGHARHCFIGSHRLSAEMDNLVICNLAKWLKGTNSPFYFNDCNWFQLPESFDDFWNGLAEAK